MQSEIWVKMYNWYFIQRILQKANTSKSWLCSYSNRLSEYLCKYHVKIYNFPSWLKIKHIKMQFEKFDMPMLSLPWKPVFDSSLSADVAYINAMQWTPFTRNYHLSLEITCDEYVFGAISSTQYNSVLICIYAKKSTPEICCQKNTAQF